MKEGIKQIKSYRLIKEIGRGANGIVYLGEHESSNRLYAVKSIPQSKTSDPRMAENLKRELKLLCNFKHNNIIKLFGVEKTTNNTYLILEYCNGGNLFDYLAYILKTTKKPVPEHHVQMILKQINSGLEYMHSNKTMHRDIKLENIMINFDSIKNINDSDFEVVSLDKVKLEDATFKLCDLGFSRELSDTNIASTLCGTPLTMAPDIFMNLNSKNKNASYNDKADLWSLGAITYELLIGHPPFLGTNYVEVFKQALEGKYAIPKKLKISLEALTFINGLLQFDPSKRLTWKEIFEHGFITTPYNKLTFLNLKKNEKFLNKDTKDLELNTKEMNNFLWIMYHPKENIVLKEDKVSIVDLSCVVNSIWFNLDDQPMVIKNSDSDGSSSKGGGVSLTLEFDCTVEQTQLIEKPMAEADSNNDNGNDSKEKIKINCSYNKQAEKADNNFKKETENITENGDDKLVKALYNFEDDFFVCKEDEEEADAVEWDLISTESLEISSSPKIIGATSIKSIHLTSDYFYEK